MLLYMAEANFYLGSDVRMVPALTEITSDWGTPPMEGWTRHQLVRWTPSLLSDDLIHGQMCEAQEHCVVLQHLLCYCFGGASTSHGAKANAKPTRCIPA